MTITFKKLKENIILKELFGEPEPTSSGANDANNNKAPNSAENGALASNILTHHKQNMGKIAQIFENKFDEYIWTCGCGQIINRDENAAINILNEGLRILNL